MKKILTAGLLLALLLGLGFGIPAAAQLSFGALQPAAVSKQERGELNPAWTLGMEAALNSLCGELEQVHQEQAVEQQVFHKPYLVGNSLIEGLRQSTDSGAMFCCEVGIWLPDLNKKLSTEGDYDCVVICMGSNELGCYDKAEFCAEYRALADRFSAPVFCLSVPPVNEAKAWARGYGHRVCNENVRLENEWLRELCEVNRYVFLDNTAVFGAELADDMTEDGLHLTAEAYQAWYAWILEQLGI